MKDNDAIRITHQADGIYNAYYNYKLVYTGSYEDCLITLLDLQSWEIDNEHKN
jgi:hypothetical protein